MLEPGADPWPPYLQTRLELGPPGAAAVAHFSTGRLDGNIDGEWHVITACNPSGEHFTAEQNQAAHRSFEAALQAAGLRHQRSLGTTPDGRWPEDGFAIAGLSRVDAIELGRSVGQHAIFEIDAEAGRLLACDTGAEVGMVRWD